MKYFAGFDIGGTKLTAVIANLRGEIIKRLKQRIDTTKDDFKEYRDGIAYLGVGNQMKEMLKRAMEESGIERIEAIGIGSAGPLRGGAIKEPANIKPQIDTYLPLYIPLVEPLEEFSVPISLENDCAAGVLGEVWWGVGKDKDKSELSLVYITLSTGFGAGVWDRGNLLRGKHGNAAEVGHLFLKEGLKCGCGNYGCAEAYCSGTGIVKNVRMQLINEDLIGHSSIIMELAFEEAKRDRRFRKKPSGWELLEFITAPMVFEAAEKGDEIACGVIEEACLSGGIAFANIANAYDPHIITVGGALALKNPQIIEPIKEEMKKHLNVEMPEVRITPLGDKIVEYGAIVLAKTRFTDG
jgi:glucokinase